MIIIWMDIIDGILFIVKLKD